MKLAPINYIVGPLGSGKSYMATKIAFEQFLVKGKPVLMNYRLYGNWPKTVAEWKANKYRSADSRYVRRQKASQLVWFFKSTRDVVGVAPPGDPDQEQRGLLVMDEQGLQMNAREWKEHGKDVLGWFTNMRKLGWVVLVITQDISLIDSQIRKLGAQEFQVTNAKHNNWPMFVKPVALLISPPGRPPRFLWRSYQSQYNPPLQTGWGSYVLDKTIARHYKSVDVFTDDAFVVSQLDPANPEAVPGADLQMRPERATLLYPDPPWERARGPVGASAPRSGSGAHGGDRESLEAV